MLAGQRWYLGITVHKSLLTNVFTNEDTQCSVSVQNGIGIPAWSPCLLKAGVLLHLAFAFVDLP